VACNFPLLPRVVMTGHCCPRFLARLGVPACWFLLSLLALLLCGRSPAQQAAGKRALTHGDYDAWRSIKGQRLSPHGQHLAYIAASQEGDGELVVRNLATGVEWRHGVGGRGGAPAAKGKGGAGVGALGGGLAFSGDGRTLVFQIMPSKADAERAKAAKK